MKLNNGMKLDDSDDEIQFNEDADGDEENVFANEEVSQGDEPEADLTGVEFSALNSTLDQLQAALDRLESRNDGLHEELLELLQSNREIRMKLIEENSSVSKDDQGSETGPPNPNMQIKEHNNSDDNSVDTVESELNKLQVSQSDSGSSSLSPQGTSGNAS